MKILKLMNLSRFSLFAVLSLAGIRAMSVECGDAAINKKAVHDFPGAGYWMQAAGDCRMTYTSVGGMYSHMYNMCTRKAEEISSDIDAFALPEGDVYMHPSGGGLSFYKMSDNLRTSGRPAPIFTDRAHRGNYESIGILPGSTDKVRKVRVAMGNQGGTIRDYEITKSGSDEYAIKTVGSDVTRICGNIPGRGLDQEIPMISRDGLMISGRELNSRKTNIYKIEMPSGNCRLLASTPTRTSKVSFSFDNKKVYYVAEESGTGSGGGILMSMDIETKEVSIVSSPNEDVQYVTTRKDGSLFYSRVKMVNGSRTRDFEVVELGPGTVRNEGKKSSFEALGLLWADACHKEVDLDMAESVGRRLSGGVCNSVVSQEAVAKLEPEYAKIELASLKAICSSKADGGAAYSESGVR